MTGRLAGKTAFITAAGQGIGRASAIAMAREGAKVIATDVNAKLLAAFDGTPGITTQVLDVLDDAAVERTIAALPPLDVMFNCAGYVHHGSILDCTPKDWDFSFNLNVRAMYVAIRAAVPRMLEKHAATGSWSSIINMASIAGSIKGLPNRFVYGLTKAAVIGLTKALAKELGPSHINVNCVAPGVIDTPMNASLDTDTLASLVDATPAGRLGTPEDIAAVIYFLAGGQADFINGQTICADGAFL